MTPFFFPTPVFAPALESWESHWKYLLDFLQVLAGQVQGLNFLEKQLLLLPSGFIAPCHR
jgi:hypothetical protein